MPGAFSAFLQNPPQVRFESQEKGEDIIFLLRRHWVTNMGWLAAVAFMVWLPLILGILVRSGMTVFDPVPVNLRLMAGMVWYLLTIGFALESFLNWYFNVYIVTDRRVIDIDFFGLSYRNVSETPIENVEDVTYRLGGPLQSFFNFGDINIQTAAEQREFEFECVPNPALVHDKLTDLVAEANRRGGRRKSK